MKTLSVAVCLLECDGKIALIKFKRNWLVGWWGLPGGKFDDTEYLPEAATREMEEEVELPIKFGKFLGLVDELVEHPDGPMRILLHVCTVEATGGQPRRIDKDEGVIDWFTRDQIAGMEREFTPSDFRIIQAAADGSLASYTKCLQRLNGDRVELTRFEPLPAE